MPIHSRLVAASVITIAVVGLFGVSSFFLSSAPRADESNRYEMSGVIRQELGYSDDTAFTSVGCPALPLSGIPCVLRLFHLFPDPLVVDDLHIYANQYRLMKGTPVRTIVPPSGFTVVSDEPFRLTSSPKTPYDTSLSFPLLEQVTNPYNARLLWKTNPSILVDNTKNYSVFVIGATQAVEDQLKTLTGQYVTAQVHVEEIGIEDPFYEKHATNKWVITVTQVLPGIPMRDPTPPATPGLSRTPSNPPVPQPSNSSIPFPNPRGIRYGLPVIQNSPDDNSPQGLGAITAYPYDTASSSTPNQNSSTGSSGSITPQNNRVSFFRVFFSTLANLFARLF